MLRFLALLTFFFLFEFFPDVLKFGATRTLMPFYFRRERGSNSGHQEDAQSFCCADSAKICPFLFSVPERFRGRFCICGTSLFEASTACVKGGLSTVSITTRMDVGGGLLCKYFELLYAKESSLRSSY